MKKTIKGYVAMNYNDFSDIANMTFANKKKDLDFWEGIQQIRKVTIIFDIPESEARDENL